MQMEPKGVGERLPRTSPPPVVRHPSRTRGSSSGTGRSVVNLHRPILTEPAQAGVLIWRRATGRRRLTLAALEGCADAGLARVCAQGRIMAHVLSVPTREDSHPVAICILMKACDDAVDGGDPSTFLSRLTFSTPYAGRSSPMQPTDPDQAVPPPSQPTSAPRQRLRRVRPPAS